MTGKTAPQRELIGSVSFSLCGEFLTDHVRERVLSNNWRGALSILTEDVEGCTHEIAYAILKGEKKFFGTTADEAGIRLVDEDREAVVADYLETLAFQYGGLLNVGGKTFRPAWRIEALGAEDYEHAIQDEGRDENGSEDFLLARVQYYAGTSGIPYHITLPKTLNTTKVRLDMRDVEDTAEWAILWQPCDDYPVWLKPHNKPTEALQEYLNHRTLRVNGADTTVHDLIRHDPEGYKKFLRAKTNLCQDDYDAYDALRTQEYNDGLAELRTKIIEQAGPVDGDGWLRLPIFKDSESSWSRDAVPSRYHAVPKLAFMHWALGGARPEAFDLIEPWEPVSPPGMKMVNDNRFHSDWVIGAGFDPETFYKNESEINDSSYAYRQRLCHDLLNFDFAVLSSSSKKTVSGKVKILKPGDTLNKDEIGVIPHAGVEFDAALRSAAKHGCAIISITGGPLAHMAVVGRELDVPIVLWDKANELRGYMTVYINLEEGKISILA